ncbi:MAG: hypothetical protein EOO61_14955 [Hymenobacter sp.]|nr:MAG: hypothetical protein EOO61_14955 [Hymenobacter sp.]
MRKFAVLTTLIVIIIAAVLFWWRYYYPFSDDGVKEGYLNKIEHKGYIFKTWEGTLIQTGLKSASPGAMQSPTFEFSVENDRIAKELQMSSGKRIALRYKQFFGTLPWRGHTTYIVDSILSMTDDTQQNRPGL